VPSDASGWTAFRVEVPLAIADVVANFLLEAGAPGVVTDEHDLVTGTTLPAGRARVEAAVPATTALDVKAALARYLAALRDLHPGLAAATIEETVVPALDWIDLARTHHRPVAVGRRLVIAPPWDVPAAADREVLVIEPGMAFGTGQHATTRGCLVAIEEGVATGRVATALDVGTGSGVLAAALARLGVPRVVGLDLDRGALAAARANLDRNGARHVALVAGGPAAVRASFDLVVANLLADALVAEAAALTARVGRDGRLIVSGILAAQAAAVAGAYPGWRVATAHAEDDWRTLVLTRTG